MGRRETARCEPLASRTRAGASGTCGAAVGAALLFVLLLTAVSAWAYRPFVSTDAAVAEPATLEIELGYFQWARGDGRNVFQFERGADATVFSSPTVVANYGFANRLELVGQFTVEQDANAQWGIVNNGLFLKAVLKEGVLQERSGISIAVETGPLLPPTVGPRGGVGFEATGIVSGRIEPITYHVNGGGGMDQMTGRPFGLWGLITELPLTPALRLVGEIEGVSVEPERPQNTALLGFIWRPFPSQELWVDGGIRRGLTRTAPDWQATLGLTVAVPLSSETSR